jgi:hypothetical protein
MNEMVDQDDINENNSTKICSFKDLLSWKIPEDLSSTNVNLSRSRVEAEYLPPPICLYKFNMVTQRIKEQKSNFVGIVTHVRQGVSKKISFSLIRNFIIYIELGERKEQIRNETS